MIAVLLAAAVLAVPGSAARDRLGALTGVASHGSVGALAGRAVPAAAVAAVVTALVCAGPLQAAAVGILAATSLRLRSAGRERRSALTRLGDWERALDGTVAAMRAGATPADALDRVAGHDSSSTRTETIGSVAEVLRSARAVARLGGGAARSLRAHGDPVAADLGAAWRLAERHGVPLVGVLDGLRADVAGRRERSLRVEAALAGPRATAVILTALPALGVLMGSGLGADPLGTLARGSLGGILCLLGAGLLAAGLLWTHRIVGGARR